MSKDVVTHSINKRAYFVVGFFFLVYLLIGLSIYRHYGLSWDESFERKLGYETREYIAGNSQDFLSERDRYYGQLFNVIKIQTEFTLHSPNYQEVLFVDHLLNFLLFYSSVFVFFLLAKKRFRSWQAGLLSSVFLVLSPVIFSHSFYNPKDTPFLSFFVFAMYTLSLVEDKPGYWRLILHALFSAAAIGVRMPGIIIPVLTLFVLLLRQLSGVRAERLPWLRLLGMLAIYLAVTAAGTILLYPAVWNDIFNQFLIAFQIFQSFTDWNGSMLFMGQVIRSENIPWYYLPVSLATTTPPLYLIFFIAGMVRAAIQLLRRPILQFDVTKRALLLDLAWCFAPVIVIILGQSIVYNSWRHIFFIYPAFLLIAIYGLLGIVNWLRGRWNKKISLAVSGVLLSISFIATITHIVQTHPLEHLYFNFLAGPNLQTVSQRYDLDYWGLSYRQALEYFDENDLSKVINVKFANRAGEFSIDILRPETRERINVVEDMAEADYYVTNMPNDTPPVEQVEEVYAVTVYGMKIAVVYRLH
jgi:hypothetical protein